MSGITICQFCVLRAYGEDSCQSCGVHGKDAQAAFEPRHEKTYFYLYSENKSADQLRGSRAVYRRLCFCYIDNIIPLLS